MRKTTGIVKIVTAFAFAGAMGFAQADLPKAETILDRFVEVTGGKAAYQKMTSEIVTGTVEMSAQGIKGTMTRYSAPPDKTLTIMELDGVGKMEQGTVGGVAWSNNAMTGPHVSAGEERTQTLRDAMFNSTLNWRDSYPKAETLGVETIDGEECYKVQLTPKEGKPVITYYQKKSGLAVKTVMTAVNQMGEIPVESIALDYKDLGNGILSPAKMLQRMAGMEISMTVSSVKANEPIPADKFEPPAEIKALLKK